MGKKKKSFDNQLSIFDLLACAQNDPACPGKSPGSMDIDRFFREIISEELSRCLTTSRYHVAARMSELTGQEITMTMLYSWTAESKGKHRFPAIFLPAFCEAVGSMRAIQELGRLVGAFVLPGPEALRAEIQRIEEDINRKQADKRRRLTFLKELEGRK